MKKAVIILLMADILLGLLLLFAGKKYETGETGEGGSGNVAGAVWIASEEQDGYEEKKKIALTFDDGPHPSYTEQLLDGLKERGVVVSFFVTGEHAKLHPDIIRRMHDEGHLIGNHTYSHMQLTAENKDRFEKELVATNKVLEELIEEEIVYVRPPYGCWDKSLEKELNMIPVLWSIDPLDWCSKDASCIAEKIIDKAGENEIILMHDYYQSSVTAALEVVDELLDEGYTFVTVDELLFD